MMTTAPPVTALQEAIDAAQTAHRTWSRWHHEEQDARQQAADARALLASAELDDPDAAFGLMATITDAHTRAASAASLAETALGRRDTARIEVTRQRGVLLQAEAAELWARWLDHRQAALALLARLDDHEGVGHQLPRRREPTRSEVMLQAARSMDARAGAAIVSAGGCYAVARLGPVVNGERDVHIGYDAPRSDRTLQPGIDLGTLAPTELQVRRLHLFDVTVDGNPWTAGALQVSSTTDGMSWTVRPVPATATVTVTSRTTGESFTASTAEPVADPT